MATMNVSITDKMRSWVESKVSDGDYATASDCMRDLLRERMEYEAKLAWLRNEVKKGFESGLCDQDWREIIEETRQEVTRKRCVG